MTSTFDNLLNITTDGIVRDYADGSHMVSEPTPYYVLVALSKSGYITKDNVVVDYGCGKGRAAIFLNHKIGCRVTGVEFAEAIYQMAEANLDSYGRGKGVEFVNCHAEDYVPVGADTFYFFNPFSLGTLNRVIKNILSCPTAKQIVFYYPTYQTEAFLASHKELVLVGSINFRFSSYNDKQNKIMIFRRVEK